MPQQVFRETITIDDFSNGMIDDLSVADGLLPRNAVRHAVNVMFDRPRGAISQRYGTTVLGDDLGSVGVTGIHNFRSATSSNHALLAYEGTKIKSLSGSTWGDEVSSLTSGLDTNFITYLDTVAFMNGTDASQSWTGSGAWVNSGGNLDVGNFPTAKMATLLNGRVVTAGDSSNPARITVSSIPSGGAISWTSGNYTEDIFPNDGMGEIKALEGNGRIVLIFKERAMYRYDENSLQRIVAIGTPANRSVCTDDGGVTYFFGEGVHSVGFYATTGGYPVKISRPILKWVEAISASYYGSISAYTDGRKVYWSVGSVTIDGKTYSNAWLVYTIADKTWEARNYADRFQVFSQYINSSSEVTTVGGDTDGYVQTIDSGTTDNTTPIYSECEIGNLTPIGREKKKSLPTIITHAKHFQGLKFFMKVDDELIAIGGIDEAHKLFDPTKLPEGYAFNPIITSANSGEPFVFEGLSIPVFIDQGYV